MVLLTVCLVGKLNEFPIQKSVPLLVSITHQDQIFYIYSRYNFCYQFPSQSFKFVNFQSTVFSIKILLEIFINQVCYLYHFADSGRTIINSVLSQCLVFFWEYYLIKWYGNIYFLSLFIETIVFAKNGFHGIQYTNGYTPQGNSSSVMANGTHIGCAIDIYVRCRVIICRNSSVTLSSQGKRYSKSETVI